MGFYLSQESVAGHPLIIKNKSHNEQLEQDIKNRALKYNLGVGISEDEKWAEESFFIENIGLEKANELARKYGQFAFVH